MKGESTCSEMRFLLCEAVIAGEPAFGTGREEGSSDFEVRHTGSNVERSRRGALILITGGVAEARSQPAGDHYLLDVGEKEKSQERRQGGRRKMRYSTDERPLLGWTELGARVESGRSRFSMRGT